jgi:hypothetical protein
VSFAVHIQFEVHFPVWFQGSLAALSLLDPPVRRGIDLRVDILYF